MPFPRPGPRPRPHPGPGPWGPGPHPWPYPVPFGGQQFSVVKDGMVYGTYASAQEAQAVISGGVFGPNNPADPFIVEQS